MLTCAPRARASRIAGAGTRTATGAVLRLRLRSKMYVSWRHAHRASVFALAVLAAGGLPAPGRALAPAAAASAAAGPSNPEQRIYRGTYYRRGAALPAQRLFWYERWHEEVAGQLRSTHIHHRLDGGVVLRQSVLHSADYHLLQFESEQRQTGVRAEARVLGSGRVRLQRRSAGEAGNGPKVETVELAYRHPLVVGPTLYGTMLRHWSELTAGRRVTVDYLSIERLDTYSFDLRRVASDDTTITFELAPSGFLLSLLVSPLRIVFASKSRQVLSYEGPSPVLLEQGSELESFDARIEYSERATRFR